MGADPATPLTSLPFSPPDILATLGGASLSPVSAAYGAGARAVLPAPSAIAALAGAAPAGAGAVAEPESPPTGDDELGGSGPGVPPSAGSNGGGDWDGRSDGEDDGEKGLSRERTISSLDAAAVGQGSVAAGEVDPYVTSDGEGDDVDDDAEVSGYHPGPSHEGAGVPKEN